MQIFIPTISWPNTSLQVGDIAYAAPISTTLDTQYANIEDLKRVGVITGIDDWGITVEEPVDYEPLPGDFIMFSKDKQANNTSLLGYYAEVKISNNSTEAAELFALSSEVAPSSK